MLIFKTKIRILKYEKLYFKISKKLDQNLNKINYKDFVNLLN